MDMESLGQEVFIRGLIQYARTSSAYQEALKNGKIQEITDENLKRINFIRRKQKELENIVDSFDSPAIYPLYEEHWKKDLPKKPTEQQKKMMENYWPTRNKLLEKEIIAMQQQNFLELQNRQQILSWLQRKYPNYVKDCCSRWQKRQEQQDYYDDSF